MEQDEITRRNVAIAEYMDGKQGFVIYDSDLYDYRPMTIEEQQHHVRQYNLHWEHIMPAVEKIMREFSENIHSWLPMSSDNPKMFHSKLHGAFWLIEGMDKPLIERVWLAVSEYVLSLKS